MITKGDKNKARLKRHLRVRKKIERNDCSVRVYCIPFIQAYVCSTD